MTPQAPPKFCVGQFVKITHAWAEKIQPAPVEHVIWDEMYPSDAPNVVASAAGVIAAVIFIVRTTLYFNGLSLP